MGKNTAAQLVRNMRYGLLRGTRAYATHLGEILVTYLTNKITEHHVVGSVWPTNRSNPGEYPWRSRQYAEFYVERFRS